MKVCVKLAALLAERPDPLGKSTDLVRLLAGVDKTRTHSQLYHVATKPTCPISTSSLVVEQMPAKGMVVSSSLTRSVGFPTGLAALPTMPQA